MSLRLGLIGQGTWGRNIGQTLSSFPDVSTSVIARGASPPAGLDGALIATPSASHAEVALPYIEAGIATFIEKPMATSGSDARRIAEAASRSGAIVFVGHLYLYHPAFLVALELLPTLGPLRHLLSEGMNAKPRSDSSVLWDWLPHDLSMAHAIFGRGPHAVSAWNLSDGSTPQAAVVKHQFPTVPMVSTVSWQSGIRCRKTTFVGEAATLIFDDNAHRRLALHRADGRCSYPAYDDTLPLTRELLEFVEAIRRGRPDPSHIEIGSGIVRAIEAAQASMSGDGQPIAIN